MIDLQAADDKMLARIIEIRKSSSVKLPDAIIAASAIENNATLLTQDTAFSRILFLSVEGF